jgi:outer membrane protein assembly factor BamB
MKSALAASLPFVALASFVCAALAAVPADDDKKRSKHDDGASAQAAPSGDAQKSHSHKRDASAVHWFVTMHGEPGGNTIRGIDGKGNLMGSMLGPVPDDAGGAPRSMRGMVYLGDGTLLAASAYLEDTRLIRFSKPGADGTMSFHSVFAREGKSGGELQHTYAIAVGPDGTVYASNQDSNTVTRYSGIGTANPGQPIPSPAAIAGLGLPEGVIVPNAKVSPEGVNGVRGIAIAQDGLLYVADRDAAEIVAFDTTTGRRMKVVASAKDGLKRPIQMLVGPRGTVYVTDNGAKAVFAIDPATGAVTTFADHSGGVPDEPSALAIDGSHLLVGDRKARKIVRFKIPEGKAENDPFVSELPDSPEFIIPAVLPAP